MAQGKIPSFTISFLPEGENASWQRIGAVWSTKNGKIHTGEITMLPLEAPPPASFASRCRRSSRKTIRSNPLRRGRSRPLFPSFNQQETEI